MRAASVFFTILLAFGAALAQDAPPSEDGIGPYHFGMSADQVRATSPSSAWTTQQVDGQDLLTGGPRVAIGGAHFSTALAMDQGALARIVLIAAAPSSCDEAIRGIVEELEPVYGPFSAAPLPWEQGLGALTITRTEAGSELRSSESAQTHEHAVYGTRAGQMFVQIYGHSSPNDPACHISLTLLPPSATGRAPEDSVLWATIDRAQTLPNLTWRVHATGDDILHLYPAQAIQEGINGGATLDCVVIEDGAVRCLASSEHPLGYGFAAAALQLATKYRVRIGARTDVIGKRVHWKINFAVTPGGH